MPIALHSTSETILSKYKRICKVDILWMGTNVNCNELRQMARELLVDSLFAFDCEKDIAHYGLIFIFVLNKIETNNIPFHVIRYFLKFALWQQVIKTIHWQRYLDFQL